VTEDDGPPDPFGDAHDHLAEMLTQMVDTMRQLAEAAAGYRNTLVAQGFSEEMAQALAMDFLRRMQAKAIPVQEGQ